MSIWTGRRVIPGLALAAGLLLATPVRVAADPLDVHGWLAGLWAVWAEQGGCIDPDGHTCARRSTQLITPGRTGRGRDSRADRLQQRAGAPADGSTAVRRADG